MVPGPLLSWPSDDSIQLVVTDGARYAQAMRATVDALASRFEQGLYVTANRPHHVLHQQMAGIQGRLRFQYIDMVTGMTGLAPPAVDGVVFVESPSFMEKMVMRSDQMLRRMPGRRVLVLDSLSTLAVYNGASLVAEMAHNLVTRLRMQRAAAALVLVERQTSEELVDTLRHLCDGVRRMDG